MWVCFIYWVVKVAICAIRPYAFNARPLAVSAPFSTFIGWMLAVVAVELTLITFTKFLKPSACTPLFLAAFDRGAGCCIHTHSQWAVLVTLLVERDFGPQACFEIEQIEQIKGIPKGRGKTGNLGYYDRLRIPIIENTAQ